MTSAAPHIPLATAYTREETVATVSTDLRLATDHNRPLTCPNYGSQLQPAADPPPSPTYR